MKSYIWWIEGIGPGRLAIIERPRGGDWLKIDVRDWKKSGLGIIVSALTSEETAEWDLLEEETSCKEMGLEFITFPIQDQNVPTSTKDVTALACRLAAAVTEGKGVGIHCRAGIGRSALLAVSVMMVLGVDFETAWQNASTARGFRVPNTDEQREWVRRVAVPLRSGKQRSARR